MKTKSIVKQFNVYFQFLQFEKQFLMMQTYQSLKANQQKGEKR